MPSLNFVDFNGDPSSLAASITAAEESSDGGQVMVEKFSALEGVSQLYRYELQFLAAGTLEASDLIGAEASVGLSADDQHGDNTRYFHGVINRVSDLGEDEVNVMGDYKYRYVVEIVPSLWFLTQWRGCRIFQDKTIPEIVEYIFNKRFIDFDNSGLEGTYESQNYRVQYRESEFDFVSRLFEEAGIYYYFKHNDPDGDADEIELILSDKLEGWFDLSDVEMTFGTDNDISSWRHDYRFHPVKYSHRDFDFKNPSEPLSASVDTLGDLELAQAPSARVYDYPGGFGDNDAGESVARLRMEELESTIELIYGASNTYCIAPGGQFSRAGLDGSFCVREANFGVSGVGGTFAVTCGFSCFPTTRQFRPPRKTPRPFVRGPQTATVVGANGEDIDVDEYGRVKAQFHWDKDGENNEDSSCRIRVSQAWAGDGYGSMMIPHVGQEVVVSFLEGNPDKPLITGRVYNEDNMPPEDLPDHKQRAIVAWDEAGNYIALDAEEERVDINNAADKFEYTVGTSASATLGMNFGITVGCGLGINVGATIGLELASTHTASAGWSTAISYGGAMSASFGQTFTYAKGVYVNAGDSLGQIAFKEDADFVSQQAVRIVGGSEGNNSVIRAASNALTLSFGTVDPGLAASTSQAEVVKGLLQTEILALLGIGGAAATTYLAGSAAEESNATALAVGVPVLGAASVAAAAAAAIMTHNFSKKWVPMRQTVHGATTVASLTLNESGIMLHAVDPAIISMIAPTVSVNGTTKVLLQAPDTDVTGNLNVSGAFNGINITDIGDAAAAAAAGGEAAAVAADAVANQVEIQAADEAGMAGDEAAVEAEVAPG